MAWIKHHLMKQKNDLMDQDLQTIVQKSFESKKNESGRSMVEMLGVVAVIGILSIAGVAGYRSAMDRQRANEVIDDLNKRAMVASQQLLSGQEEIDLSEFSDRVAGLYAIQTGLAGEHSFVLAVSDVPENICQHIVDSDWDVPYGIDDENNNDILDCQETNNMLFYFTDDLYSEGEYETGVVSHNVEETETTSTPEGDCSDGYLIHGVERHTYCVSNTEMKWDDAKKWCSDRGMQLASASQACDTDTYSWTRGDGQLVCPNIKGTGSGYWWTSTSAGSDACYVYPYPGGISYDGNLLRYSFAALCLYAEDPVIISRPETTTTATGSTSTVTESTSTATESESTPEESVSYDPEESYFPEASWGECGPGMFKDDIGDCQSCDTKETIYINYNGDISSCRACGRFVFLVYGGTNINYYGCAPKCGQNEFNGGPRGSCISCDTTEDVSCDSFETGVCDFLPLEKVCNQCKGKRHVKENSSLCVLGSGPVSECSRNADCGNRQYCETRAQWESTLNGMEYDWPSGGEWKYSFGRCKSKDTPSMKKIALDNGGSILISESEALNWWSAQNWCAAHGKRLARLRDVDADVSHYTVDQNNQYIKALNENGAGTKSYWLSDPVDPSLVGGSSDADRYSPVLRPSSGSLNYYNYRTDSHAALCL